MSHYPTPSTNYQHLKMDPPERQEEGREVSMEEEMNHDRKEEMEEKRLLSLRPGKAAPEG